MSISKKIARLTSGEKPRVLDLFAGCGGISLGFHSAGFEIVGAVEIDAAAAKSHALNFHPKSFNLHARSRDITAIDPPELLNEFTLTGPVKDQVDVIVGGPPCQAFARVGRAKLREIAEHPDAFLRDPRSNLYLRYLDYVRALQPIALVMENVPDVLNYGGHNIAEEVCEALEDLGYLPKYTILNAVFYGVPEMRERMFLVAYRKELKPCLWHPQPSHWIDLPQGYHGSRQVALQTVKFSELEEHKYFVDPPEPDPSCCLPAITAEEALSDLPVISEDSPLKLMKGPRHFKELAPYRKPPGNAYQRLMREWEGFLSSKGVSDHVIRYLPRDYKIFARMNPGDQYPEAHELAKKMFAERLLEIECIEGEKPQKGSSRYELEWVQYVPPYDPGKFPNKWRKMEADKPARTLMAHLGKDSYSHIHYDSSQARTISVREAARLQSFPDGFVFQGPMNPAFKQIGNAVPPLMAKAVAEVIINELQGSIKHAEKISA
ncbi:DNA cytosine methyltransferase [Trichlorobacter ammonificans]|uniref:DNA (cytosine-5-)-methyltransferase n=1 Tax=Trichlorobacter ammonificans TaxID=2916410 RepID=A0ABM9D911_9BACT|nr:DNA cytosine methyltransferase [Trichlorobacter ammonificans]CAH2031721.1 DNA (cytosine-5-)-methyltransferase [Trichlorobacter ammonificans]